MYIKQKAHKYLIDKGCLSVKQTYTAFEVEKMLVECVEEILRETKQENFYEGLEKYFETTPREKVLEDWNKSAHLDNVGPTVDEFLENTNKQQKTLENDNKWSLEKAKEFALNHFKKDEKTTKKGIVTWESVLDVLKAGVEVGYKFGTKWKQERSYSEEDILDAWELGAREGLPLTREKKEKLFNQFKNKQNLQEPKKIDMSLYTIGFDPYDEFQKELSRVVWSVTSEETETRNNYKVEDVFDTLEPVKYENTPECKSNIEYGRYLVVRKDGKKHLETFNGTGWAYNNSSIVAYYIPKLD